jgi:hypothetical protein
MGWDLIESRNVSTQWTGLPAWTDEAQRSRLDEQRRADTVGDTVRVADVSGRNVNGTGHGDLHSPKELHTALVLVAAAILPEGLLDPRSSATRGAVTDGPIPSVTPSVSPTFQGAN